MNALSERAFSEGSFCFIADFFALSRAFLWHAVFFFQILSSWKWVSSYSQTSWKFYQTSWKSSTFTLKITKNKRQILLKTTSAQTLTQSHICSSVSKYRWKVHSLCFFCFILRLRNALKSTWFSSYSKTSWK